MTQATSRLSGVSDAGVIIAESARMQVMIARTAPMFILLTGVQPVVMMLVVVSGRLHRTPEQTRAIVVALLLAGLWGTIIWTAGGIMRRELAEGTLTRSLLSVRDPRLVIVGKCIGSTALNLAALLVTGTLAFAVARLPFAFADLGWLVAGLLVLALSGTALGMALSCVFVLTRHGIVITSMLMQPVLILGGLLIPLSYLPQPLRWVSSLISLRWLRQFLTGVAGGDVRLHLLLIGLLLTLGYALLASLAFTRVVEAACRKGTLDLD